MKVLIIGQLPKEIGGNYTTGAANVVYELSRQKSKDVESFVYGTNINQHIAVNASTFPNQYLGYEIKPFRIVWQYICHPIDSVRHLWHYITVDHQNIFRFAFYEDNIRHAIKLIEPNLIHVNSINNVSVTRFALDGKQVPILLTCHGIFWRGDKDNKKEYDRYMGNIRLVDCYSGLTNESLYEYQNYLGVNREQVYIIPNGVDCGKFYFSENERLALRREMKVALDTKVIITVASVQERKGQFEFVKFLERLENMNVQYWIVGSGPDIGRIAEYIDEHRMQDKVKLLGRQSTDVLYRYYSAADYYAHVSTMEGQALCEIEAYACGLRTILNKKIKGSISSNPNSDDYFILDYENLDIDKFTLWINKQYERVSRTNLDWSYIYKLYCDVFIKIHRSYNYGISRSCKKTKRNRR